MKQQEFFFSEQDVEAIARQLFVLFPDERVFFFKGTLGAGKTTFIKALCRQLNIHSPLSSPSFSIINEYVNADEDTVAYHMDLYRLKNLEEAESIGLHEYFERGQYCFVEWPEIIEDYVQAVVLDFDIVDSERRRVTVSG